MLRNRIGPVLLALCMLATVIVIALAVFLWGITDRADVAAIAFASCLSVGTALAHIPELGIGAHQAVLAIRGYLRYMLFGILYGCAVGAVYGVVLGIAASAVPELARGTGWDAVAIGFMGGVYGLCIGTVGGIMAGAVAGLVGGSLAGRWGWCFGGCVGGFVVGSYLGPMGLPIPLIGALIGHVLRVAAEKRPASVPLYDFAFDNPCDAAIQAWRGRMVIGVGLAVLFAGVASVLGVDRWTTH
jgi:MFS family permease